MDRVNNRDPIGLYIHIPFCRKKCGYCDFYSITDLSFAEKYTEAVVRGILFYKSTYGLRFDSVYFGGGTPSLMTARQIEHMVEAGSPERNAEISMECNPNSVGTQFFSDVKAAGINRASIGIQSLSDGVLKTLGRLHSAAEAEAAIAHAAAAGFDNISVDLMIGVPGQHSLKSDIERLSALKNTDGKHIIKHISAYILKVEEDTPFADIPAENFPNEDTVSDIYLETVAELEANGFCQYEISNFSIPGFECCHNLKYWECKEYLGIGPAAHSYIDGRRFAIARDIRGFLESENPRAIEVSADNHAGTPEERLMLGLRLMKCGIELSEYAENFPKIAVKAKVLAEHGLLTMKNNRICLTPRGALLSNSIITELQTY